MPEITPRSLYALARHAVVFELRLYRSLARWLARRPHVPAATQPVGYAQGVTPVLALWIFASAAEVPLVHVLIPWDGVRIAALVLGVWGLLWMVGFLASLRVYPHLFGEEGMRIRHGASVDLRVPWHAVASIAVDRQDLPSSMWTLQPRETEDGVEQRVAVSGQVNVRAMLREPLTVSTPKGPQTIHALSFLVDDPRAVVADARARMAAVADGPSPSPR